MDSEARPHRPVVMTVQQRDELNDIKHLLHAIEIAILGTELDAYEQSALCELVRTVDRRLTALIQEFDAFAEASQDDAPMNTKAKPSLVEVRDIHDHVRRFAKLIEIAAKSLEAGHDEGSWDAISMGTNAIIDEIETADEMLGQFTKGETP